MGRNWDKFRLLMWKNWVLQYRKPIQSVIEIIIPALLSVALVYIRSLNKPELQDAKLYDTFCPTPIDGFCDDSSNMNFWLDKWKNYFIVYSPENEKLKNTLAPLNLLFKNVSGMKDAQAMEDYFASYDDTGSYIFAGLQFDDNLTDLPNNLELALRFPGIQRHSASTDWMTNLVYPAFQTPGPRNPQENYGASPSYYNECFLSLQHIVTWLLIAEKNNIELPTYPKTTQADWEKWWSINKENFRKLNLPLLLMKRFSHSPYYNDVLIQILASFVGMIFMLSFVYTCTSTVRTITQEKELQLKESMKIMGLPNWLHWTAWFIKCFIFLCISVILMVILLKVPWFPDTDYTVFTHTNTGVLFLFLILYVSATITFCFAISTIFSKANTAASMASLFWFVSYSPMFFMANSYDTTTLSTKLLSSLLSNTALGLGFTVILRFEGSGEGAQFSNLFRTVSPDDNLTLGAVMLMLVLDAFLYLAIALYVEAVFPGEYGVPKPWNFLFTASFWRKSQESGANSTEDSIEASEIYEKEPNNLNLGIKIRNLKKVFGKKAAVRNLTLNMFEDQITALLGHNGAGKTTTMSMLTGMFPSTSGTAIVNGYDIRTNIEGVRDSLGLCPQHNIIFEELTVEEHLYFFSRLKGMTEKDIKSEIDKYINLLELQDKRKKKSKTLSGGMKRKLCVGMALCGNSKVVLLDEPTAGMDPSARRALWDLLLKQKKGRTILLSTHFMDEADLLGDRISIMAGGELQCCGSSFFLKKRFGTGYHLIMDKTKDCDTQKITYILKRHIPTIEIENNIGSELTYLLPEDQSHIFEAILKNLEDDSYYLGINSFGISVTTLEEVFMKVGADHGQEELYNNNNNNEHANGQTLDGETYHDSQNITVSIDTSPKTTSCGLILNQFRAMFLKRILSAWRSWMILLFQIFMPAFFLIILLSVDQSATAKAKALPAMPLNLDKFSDPITLAELSSINNDVSKNLYENYNKSIGSGVHDTTDINATIMDLTASEPSVVRRRYLIGASFVELSTTNNIINELYTSSITTYFNNDPYHTPGIAMGFALNAIYKTTCENCNLAFINKPFPFDAKTQVQQLTTDQTAMGLSVAFNLGFSMMFASSCFIIFIIRERVSGAKHLQFVSGAKVLVFWLTTYACDLMIFLCTITVYLITLVCFQKEGFSTFDELVRMALLLFCFGWSVLPVIYHGAYLWQVPSTGYTRISMIALFTGPAAFLIITILKLINENVGKALENVFLIVPLYSLPNGVYNAYTMFSDIKICSKFPPEIAPEKCKDIPTNYYQFNEPGIGRNILVSIITGCLYFILLLLRENKVFSKISCKLGKNKSIPQLVENEDNDVVAEKNLIHDMSEQEINQKYSLALKDLTKYYNKHLAVNGLYLGVSQYECFGLLGTNGAGKTTTFKMMTGDTDITYGDVWVCGNDVKNNPKEAQKVIGYCPQFDALLDDLTARETLQIFSLLRGLQNSEAQYLAESLAKEFDFYRHLDKKVKELSGGNKRKLSTSLALVGNPPVLYLDEPTTGMDPATKRYLWNAMCKLRDRGKTIILTSHSMEECEALCTRLAIMVNGNFKCLGSTQHLKSKFAEGYTISIKVKKSENSDVNSQTGTEVIEQFIQHNFRGAQLKEKHDELLTYYVTDKSLPWSRMFGILEDGKRQNPLIEDYSLGQSSLEQVFLSFTKYQNEQK